MIELLFLGFGVGLLSGFFGVGGGTILVPSLLFLGFETKVAIGISVVQMVFSSLYGSYLNNKKGSLDLDLVLFIAFGGFGGALLSGYIASFLSDTTLEVLFLAFAIFALVRMFMTTHQYATQKKASKIVLLITGFILGALSMTIGVGGSILLVPLLVGFFHVPLKKAVSAGLFFVIFSSVSGLISHALEGSIDYKSGIIIGLASLFGVYGGIHLKEKVDIKLQKKLLTFFYLLVVTYLAQRVFL
jgi:uncharacterized membrane protein YfcA